MGMTDKQFQGFVRLALSVMKEALKISPENEKLLELHDIFQLMLEDGDQQPQLNSNL